MTGAYEPVRRRSVVAQGSKRVRVGGQQHETDAVERVCAQERRKKRIKRPVESLFAALATREGEEKGEKKRRVRQDRTRQAEGVSDRGRKRRGIR